MKQIIDAIQKLDDPQEFLINALEVVSIVLDDEVTFEHCADQMDLTDEELYKLKNSVKKIMGE